MNTIAEKPCQACGAPVKECLADPHMGISDKDLEDDRAEVKLALSFAVRAFLAEGRTAPCGEHDEHNPDCQRCRWVMRRLEEM